MWRGSLLQDVLGREKGRLMSSIVADSLLARLEAAGRFWGAEIPRRRRTPIATQSFCQNMNHGRLNAPVRSCPDCGEVVNAGISPRACSEAEHAQKQREQSTYCVDCGKRLIGGR